MKFLFKLLIVLALLVGGLAIWGHMGDGGRLDVRVEQTVQAPVTTVFARLSDHANWDQFPGISGAELLEPSPLPLLPNATGAVRRIEAGGMSFIEEITGYTPLRRLEYRITEATPLPIAHDGASIVLTPAGLDETTVVWESRGRVDVPVLGPAIGKLMRGPLADSFRDILGSIR